jgi:hypothetical protein
MTTDTSDIQMARMVSPPDADDPPAFSGAIDGLDDGVLTGWAIELGRS